MAFLRYVWHTLQYIYYLRFSLLLWLSLPVIVVMDHRSHISILHAIFTPEAFGQFFAASFFAVAIGWVALLLARVICINGGSRFRTPLKECVPSWVNVALGCNSEKYVLWALLLSQLPTAVILYCAVRNAMAESVDLHKTHAVLAVLLGALASTVFWYLINVFYYWTFPFARFKRSAVTMLFPRSFFGLGAPVPPGVPTPDTIEALGAMHPVHLWKPLEWLFAFLTRLGPGYACHVDTHDQAICGCTPGKDLWEGHRLVTLGVIGYLLVYAILWPLTAPLPMVSWQIIAFAFAAVVLGILSYSFFSVRIEAEFHKTKRWRNGFGVSFLLLAILCAAWAVCSSLNPSSIPDWVYFGFRPPFQFFPVIGSVAVLLTFLCFIFAGVSFFLDRYSFPAISVIAVLLVLAHYVLPFGSEHYYPALDRQNASAPLKTPADLLAERCPENTTEDCSLIVVTATGGGMHAAVWSSSSLVSLEKFIAKDPVAQAKNQSLHQQIFFTSTVSGGSVGIVPFLREYLAKPSAFNMAATVGEGKVPNFERRIHQAAACSALESVAWGLEYTDLAHLITPFLHVSRIYDRSISLERAAARNYTESKCQPDDKALPTDGLEALGSLDPSTEDPNQKFTLAQMQPSANFPAVTLNTTEVETGGRFLLANYDNQHQLEAGVCPASSFLDVYPGKDLNLITAARLSASFPGVSTPARIDMEKYSGPAAHFVDGGFYDNDGIASLVEFIGAAFNVQAPDYKTGRWNDCKSQASQQTQTTQQAQAPTQSSSAPATPAKHRYVRILLVELRDGPDLDMSKSPEATCWPSENCTNWGLSQEADAPLQAFWKTGHDSISWRNRRELTLLRAALKDRAEIEEVVFPFNGYTPLSWHLSPHDQQCIRDQVSQSGYQRAQVLDWLHADGKPQARWQRQNLPSSCLVAGSK